MLRSRVWQRAAHALWGMSSRWMISRCLQRVLVLRMAMVVVVMTVAMMTLGMMRAARSCVACCCCCCWCFFLPLLRCVLPLASAEGD